MAKRNLLSELTLTGLQRAEILDILEELTKIEIQRMYEIKETQKVSITDAWDMSNLYTLSRLTDYFINK